MSLQDLQVHLPEGYLLIFGPYQQNTRRFRPGHSVADGDEVIVRFERDDLGFHSQDYTERLASHLDLNSQSMYIQQRGKVMRHPANIIITNANVFTSDQTNPHAEAVRV